VISLANEFITSQGFAEHGNERPVPREKNSVRLLMYVAALRGDVQTDQRLAGPRHSGEEADQLPFTCFRLFHQFFNPA
jgi:hypothetical protein